MIYFADGLRIYLVGVLLFVLYLSVKMTRPYWKQALRRGTSRSRHVVKVASSHVGLLGILAVDNLQECGQPLNYQLGFFVVFSTLTASSLVDLILSQRRGPG